MQCVRDPSGFQSLRGTHARSGGAFIAVYFFAYVYYLHRGFRLLRSRPYASFRVGNVLLRVQVRNTLELNSFVYARMQPPTKKVARHAMSHYASTFRERCMQAAARDRPAHVLLCLIS